MGTLNKDHVSYELPHKIFNIHNFFYSTMFITILFYLKVRQRVIVNSVKVRISRSYTPFWEQK